MKYFITGGAGFIGSNLVDRLLSGGHIITMTNDIFNKVPQVGKDLNQLSLETVQMFYSDAQSAGYKI